MSNNAVTPEVQLLQAALAALQRETLRRVVFSKPQDSSRVRATMTPRRIGGALVLQLETMYSDNKARQENFSPDDVAALEAVLRSWGQVNVVTGAGNCELRRAKGGKVTLLHVAALVKALQGEDVPAVTLQGNNRQKKYILSGDEPFLKYLGVSDATGRVYDKKQSKFRQINRFLELLRDVEDRLPAEGRLNVCDLCCGKSYLSFAVYHYLTAVKGREVCMIGVDLKSDVVEDCSRVARALDFDGLTFRCGDVAAFEPEHGAHVHLVVSLHACDVATDLVLSRAMRWQSEVILSTPCCHHALNHALDCPELSCIAEHSMLRQKLCDAATDAMRLLLLEANGYSVAALELIDPEETPKNIMLRAIRKRHSSPEALSAARKRYEDAVRFFVRTPGRAQDSFLQWGEDQK